MRASPEDDVPDGWHVSAGPATHNSHNGGRKHGLRAEYGVKMIVKGHRVDTTISWPRVKDPATTPELQRKPKQLMVALPRHSDFLVPKNEPKAPNTYAKFTIPITFAVKNPDNTYGIKVGTHKIKSRFDDNEDIEATIYKLESGREERSGSVS